jgi:ubiquilin
VTELNLVPPLRWQYSLGNMSSSDEHITVVIRPTSRGNDERFAVVITPSATVLQLKHKTAEHCSLKAEDQRLIYKGKVLKDEMTVQDYGELLPLP